MIVLWTDHCWWYGVFHIIPLKHGRMAAFQLNSNDLNTIYSSFNDDWPPLIYQWLGPETDTDNWYLLLRSIEIFWFETQTGAPGYIEDYHILFNIATLHITLSLYNKLTDTALCMYMWSGPYTLGLTGSINNAGVCLCVCVCVCECVCVRHQSVNSYQF